MQNETKCQLNSHNIHKNSTSGTSERLTSAYRRNNCYKFHKSCFYCARLSHCFKSQLSAMYLESTKTTEQRLSQVTKSPTSIAQWEDELFFKYITNQYLYGRQDTDDLDISLCTQSFPRLCNENQQRVGKLLRLRLVIQLLILLIETWKSTSIEMGVKQPHYFSLRMIGKRFKGAARRKYTVGAKLSLLKPLFEEIFFTR